MRKFKNIFFEKALYSAALLMLSFSAILFSCSKHHSPEKEDPQLRISVYIPQPLATKADEGIVRSDAEERAIKKLVVWLFKHDDGSFVYCLNKNQSDLASYNLENGVEARFLISQSEIPTLESLASEKPKLDVYAVANPESAGMTEPTGGWESLTRAQLEALYMSDNFYGTQNLITSVPADGLPYSGVEKNCSITGSFPVLSVDKVTLNRCVSKFRLLLCRMEVEDSEFQITSIKINGGAISAKEYVFTSDNPWRINGYESGDIVLASSPITAPYIAINNTPGDLFFRGTGHASETPDQYWTRLDAAVAVGNVTEQSKIYFRETDKIITGEIKYKTTATGEEKTKTFTMDAAGDFARNHVWVVYAYFVGGRLVIMPTVLPWTAGNDRYSFKTQGRTDIYVSSWLRYTPSMRDNDWTETWIAVAYGFDESHPGYPKYSTQIDVDLVNENRLRLQLDNDNFRFVILEEGETVPIVWDRSVSGLDSDIIYEMAPGAHKFSFWIIPKDDYSYQGEESIVGLRLIAIPAAMAPYIIPISHNFPGNSAHSDIRFRRVSRQDYSDNMDNTYQGDDISAFWKEPKE